MSFYLNGVGVYGAGLQSWEVARSVLSNKEPYYPNEIFDPSPEFLPPNELRRSSAVVRWSLQVAYEALIQAQVKADETLTVFATSGGETAILHHLCEALAKPERIVSPTMFHQSVHNGAAGYWSIGMASSQPSISLACFDSTMSGGLLEAGTLMAVEEKAVLLVVYDHAPPPPLYVARPLSEPFASAFLLAREKNTQTLAKMTVNIVAQNSGEESSITDPKLERLRKGNPAARALPVLAAVANDATEKVFLNYLDDLQLMIDVVPCLACPN